MKGYKINYTEGTIVMNLQFSKAAAEYGTPEYTLVQSIMSDYPHYALITQKGRNPKTSHQFKRLTYANMETYIKAQSGSEAYLAAFEIAKQESKSSPSPYKFVRDWFTQTFPSFRECKTFDREALTLVKGQKEEQPVLDMVSNF